VQICEINRTFSACLGQITPTQETCNNKDDDCDGQIDNSNGGCKIDEACALIQYGSGETGGVCLKRCAGNPNLCPIADTCKTNVLLTNGSRTFICGYCTSNSDCNGKSCVNNHCQ
jgi:hypothetical protein